MSIHQVEATVIVMKSKDADCICCDGNHVYMTPVILDKFSDNENQRTIYDFIRMKFHLKKMDLKRLKITVEEI